jgi:[ribosomal protein S18]-alanine N-acetyltransferase
MKVERLGTGEAGLLAELESAAFEHPWSAASLRAELDKEGSLALAIRGADGGLEAAALFSTVAGEAELLRIATRPEARRRGHGRRLLEDGLARLAAAGIAAVFLEVAESNAPARSLYRAMRFEENGRRPAYYRDGTAAVLYGRAP